MRRAQKVLFACGMGLLAAACNASTGGAPGPDAGSGDAPVAAADASDGASAAPITAPAGQWTWVDVPGTACDDGSPTGIGVYPSASSDKLLLWFPGGNVCWNYVSCTTGTPLIGPFSASQFDALQLTGSGGILDPTDAANPFKDWNLVYVPYCTDDLHAGDVVQTYTLGSASLTVHQVGHTNLLADLEPLAATFRSPSQIAVTGESAGGARALFNYPSVRAQWPASPTLLVDDSFPAFEGKTPYLAAWFDGWDLAKVTGPVCGAPCEGDLSLFMSGIAKKYPADRMALLASQQDDHMCPLNGLQGPACQAALAALATDVLDPTGNFKHYFVPGSTHTMLGDPAAFAADGVPLWTWLTQMETGDPGWLSVSDTGEADAGAGD